MAKIRLFKIVRKFENIIFHSLPEAKITSQTLKKKLGSEINRFPKKKMPDQVRHDEVGRAHVGLVER